GMSGYGCFGCAPDKPFGLKLGFHEEADEVTSCWSPPERFQGWTAVRHGAKQATATDELASWALCVTTITAGVTSRMETEYRRPVPIGSGELVLKARVIGVEGNRASIQVDLLDPAGRLCSQSTVTYFLFSPELALAKLHYPGPD